MPDERKHNDALDLISEILDKMIDMQQASTEATTGLKTSVEESCRSLQEINSHFKNGFRSELKNHITREIENVKCSSLEARREIEELKASVEEFKDLLAKPSYWVKLILTTVGATAAAIGTTVAVIMRIMG